MVVISFAINVNREIAPSQNVACKKDLQPGRTARNQTARADSGIAACSDPRRPFGELYWEDERFA